MNIGAIIIFVATTIIVCAILKLNDFVRKLEHEEEKRNQELEKIKEEVKNK